MQVFDVIEADVAEQMKQSRKDLEQLMEKSAQSFPDADPAERDMLQSFDCLCRLGADIYFKKLFIEKTLDQEKGRRRGVTGRGRDLLILAFADRHGDPVFWVRNQPARY
jgi:hypothetical protein